MKIIKKYMNELTRELYDTPQKAKIAEKKERGIRKIFNWIVDGEKATIRIEELGSCKFANGKWCVQRSKEFYDHLVNSIIEAAYIYEPWIYKEYEKHGGLKSEHVHGMTLLGRYLDDSSSSIRKYNNIQMCICHKCYREYGQPYYAINCKCNGTSGEKGQYKIETRLIPSSKIKSKA